MLELDRIPEVRCLRNKMDELSADNVALIVYHCSEGLNLDTLTLVCKADSVEFEQLWARIDSTIKAQKRFHEHLA